MSYQIRPYNTLDHDTVYEICLKTGNSGKGAEHLHDDPMILGHIYAGPYITQFQVESGLFDEKRKLIAEKEL